MAQQENPTPLHRDWKKTLAMLLKRLGQTGGEYPLKQTSVTERKFLKRAIACGESGLPFIALHKDTKDISPQIKTHALLSNFVYTQIRLGNTDIVRIQEPPFNIAEWEKKQHIPPLKYDVSSQPNTADQVSNSAKLKEHFAEIYQRDDADTAAILLENLAAAGGPIAFTDSRYTKPAALALAMAYHQGTKKKELDVPFFPDNANEAQLYHEAALMHFLGSVMRRGRSWFVIDYLKHIMPPDKVELYIGTFDTSRGKHHANSTRENYPKHEIFESVY